VRFALMMVGNVLIALLTGCAPLIQTGPTAVSPLNAQEITAHDLLAPLAERINNELIVGTWSGSIEWNRRKTPTNQESQLIPLTVQSPTHDIWSIKLSITQQKTEKGETLLQGKATIYVNNLNAPNSNFSGGTGSYVFSGFVLVKIIKQVIIIRLYLSDGTVLFIKKCRIVLIFRSVWTGQLWGQSRIYNCSKEFSDWTSFGSFQLKRTITPILAEPTLHRLQR